MTNKTYRAAARKQIKLFRSWIDACRKRQMEIKNGANTLRGEKAELAQRVKEYRYGIAYLRACLEPSLFPFPKR